MPIFRDALDARCRDIVTDFDDFDFVLFPGDIGCLRRVLAPWAAERNNPRPYEILNPIQSPQPPEQFLRIVNDDIVIVLVHL